MQIDVSIVLVNYCARGLVRECIKGLKRLTTNLRLEIIVVDNSNDKQLADLLAERFGDVKYIPMQTNVGFARANNMGISHSGGKYILILNYDITPLPDSLDTLVSYMDVHPQTGIVGPQLLNPDGTTQNSCYRFHSLVTPFLRRTWFGKIWKGKRHIDRFLMRDTLIGQPTDVDWLLGACLLVRASCIADVGLMDERFFLYFEDTDWCRRFWDAGYKVKYVPDAKMIHLHRRDSAQGGALAVIFHSSTRIHIASWIKYILKWRNNGKHIA
ncbi:glycosyltransferase family 2 protein [Candidatus Uhrbacteria bacterium]|nr:glycosyltransferase family 2 protein [Candidatus Uhrbacteria bacterium]